MSMTEKVSVEEDVRSFVHIARNEIDRWNGRYIFFLPFFETSLYWVPEALHQFVIPQQ